MGTKLAPHGIRTAAGVVAVVAIVVVAWSRSSTGVAREEMPAVPGAAVSHEGRSSQTELFDEALRLLGRRNFVGAESVYREVLVREPLSAPAYVGIGTARFHQGDLVGARQHYGRALELDSASAGAALGLGSVAYQERRYAAALRFYQRALASQTSEPDAHWGLGLTYDALGKIEDAKKHYAAFLRLAPKSGQAELARTRLSTMDAQPAHD